MIKNFFNKTYFYGFIFLFAQILFYLTIDYFPKNYRIDLFRAFVFILSGLLYLTNNKIKIEKTGKIILLFILLLSLSSLYTLLVFNYFDKVYFKIVISSFYYFLGYNLINDLTKFKYLINVYLKLTFILIISIIIANTFKLGPQQYNSNFYFGSMGVNIVKLLPIIFFPLFISFNFIKWNNLKYNVIILMTIGISIIFCLISMKRGTIVGLALSFIFYISFSKINIKKYKLILGINILILILSQLFWSDIQNSFTKRQNRFKILEENKIEEEARYWEFKNTISKISFNEPLKLLFGYGFKSEFFIYNTTRIHHTDYMSLLHGLGITGLIIFLLFYIYYIKTLEKLKSKIHNNKLFYDIRSVCYAIIIYLIILGFSGTIHIIELRGYSLFFLGASLRILKNFYHETYTNR